MFCEAGGLMSYGVNIDKNIAGAASYVDRILRGANPAELPVQAPTEFELVVNQKAARQLGPATAALRHGLGIARNETDGGDRIVIALKTATQRFR
jgi:ABC-type uncharacterized transport system substrate-binding protein